MIFDLIGTGSGMPLDQRQKINVLLMMSGHVQEYDHLLHKSTDESLLSSINKFYSVDLNGGDKDLVGNYLLIDIKRSVVIYRNFANTFYQKEWTKHVSKSMLREFADRSNKLSAFYPNVDSMEAILIHTNNIKGRFVDLKMKLGIGVTKDKMSNFIQLFEFSNYEMVELYSLMARFGEDK